MAVIDYTDVATAIGRPISSDEEQAQVDQWISDVEMLLAARLDDLTELDQGLLAYVEREVVIARMRYKEDRNTDADNNGPSPGRGLENYFLRILEPWWELLVSTDDTGTQRAYSVSLLGPDVLTA